MTRVKLDDMTSDGLADQFVALALDQYKALFEDNVALYNELFKRMAAVKAELKSRLGDQRRALFALYEHANVQVRLMAAHATLALAPVEARQLLEEIAASGLYPQAGSAGMALWTLDEGIYKPA